MRFSSSESFMLCLSLLSVCSCFSIASADPDLDGLSIAQACGVHNFTTDFEKYRELIDQRFNRNILPSLKIPKDTEVQFFLTREGEVRDVEVTKSSGSRIADLACMDAIYSASPLPPPPFVKSPLPPPPEGRMLPPKQYGSSTYEFTFAKRSGTPSKRFMYPMVPLDLQYRFDKLFSQKELESDSNIFDFPPEAVNAEMLENSRFQWEKFYKDNPNPTKQSILEWAKEAMNRFVKSKEGERLTKK